MRQQSSSGRDSTAAVDFSSCAPKFSTRLYFQLVFDEIPASCIPRCELTHKANAPPLVCTLCQVKVFGPRLASAQHNPSLLDFMSPEFQHFACIR